MFTVFWMVCVLFLKFLAEAGEEYCSASCENFEDQVKFDLERSFRWGCPKGCPVNKCAECRLNQIQNWIDNNGINRILVTGKMGSGKTTFIRGLTENAMLHSDPLLPHMKEVTRYEGCHELFCFVFFDTPGLKDDENSSNDHNYLTQMVKKNGEPNLLVYTVKMDDYVIQEDDKEAIKSITDAFGWRVWKKAVFILTFANMVGKVGLPSNSVENKKHFGETRDNHRRDILKALKNNKVEKEVLDSINVVPVGVKSNPNIPAKNQSGSWIDNFWKAANKILLRKKKTYDTPPPKKKSCSSWFWC